MNRDELLELRARAICRAMFPNVIEQMAWENTSPFKKSNYYLFAEATMKAEDAGGLAVVPREATEEMALAMGTRVYTNIVKERINAANRAGNLLKETTP